jgi:antitoxin component of RelBE/YafQ-DinJ toxin-antitoxin module
MNITLSVDDRIIERASKVVESMGLSLNQAVRNYLEQLAGEESAEDDIREMEDLSSASNGHSKGWNFNRDEIHERA